MTFKLQATDTNSWARAGEIQTDHGTIQTPIFMPVGTVGSVKCLHFSELPEQAFSNCYSLKKAVFPDGLIKIGAYSFSDCISLENPDMPASLVSIGEFAFMGCHSIKTADLGGADYGKGVWMDCRRLTDISFSGKKIKISDYLFAGCVSLSTLNIPSNVTSIGEASFRYCTGLNRIEINNSVTDIKRDAFSDCGTPVIAAPQTSAAHRYALAFGFKYEDTSKS